MTSLSKSVMLAAYCFFFSSRRRHTRCSRDWSSDVCSSDLLFSGGNLNLAKLAIPVLVLGIVAQAVLVVQFVGDLVESSFEFGDAANFQHEIGRASCRERV